jgi:3-oxoacyl-[acyl-carrier protein] reductase
MNAASNGSGERRVAIVTGGTRGMGRATVLRLAALGYAVVVNYLHDQRLAESTVEAVLGDRGDAVAIRADVADELDVERLFAQTVETFGSIDAVIHGVRGRVVAARASEATVDDLEGMWRTSVRSAFIVGRTAARQVRRGGAVAILFSSVGPSAGATYGAYATIAAAIERLTRVLALEARERDVTVNAVSLGVDEPCAPGRVADAVAHLLGEEGRGISGRVVHA